MGEALFLGRDQGAADRAIRDGPIGPEDHDRRQGLVAGATVDVPLSVVVTDPSPDHLSLHAQGRQTAMLAAGDHQVPGNISLDYTVNFHSGAFAGAQGVVFADASPDTTVHSVTNWHLAPE